MGNMPRQPASTSPSAPSRAADGCELNPIVAHDSNVSSQYIGNEKVPVRSMKSIAWLPLSWVPSPMTRIVSM